MKGNALLYAAVGLASGFLIARIVPNIWWANLITLGALLGIWLYMRGHRRR